MNAIQHIKSNITEDKVLKLLERHDAKEINKIGNTYRCGCPIHGGDNTTAFSYNPENHLWCCFTECGGGDIFTLISLLNDLDIEKSFTEVITKTAEELRIDISGLDIGKHEDTYIDETNAWLKYALKREEIFNTPYDLSKLGSRYALNDFRGISEHILKNHGVGYLKELNRYIFPIFNAENKVIGASLRAIGEEKPKWLHRPKSIKTGHILYNLYGCVLEGYRTVIVVEGIIDCLRLMDLGVPNVVCTFGARVTDEQFKLFLLYFDDIILAFDNDKAGKIATEKAIEKMKKVLNVFVLDVKGYKDVGEIRTSEEFNNLETMRWYEWLSKEGI